MKNFKSWLNQVLATYNKQKCNKEYKKENKPKVKRELPEGVILTTYITVIDTIIILGLITLFIIRIL